MATLAELRARCAPGAQPLVLDGGLATELERGGARLSGALWSARLLIDDPGATRRAHEAFVRAGADIVSTASYQLSYAGLASAGVEGPAADRLFRRAVELAREAVEHAASGPRSPWVAASIGPYGAHLADGSEYRGDYVLADAKLIDFHRRQVEALAGAGPDLLLFETIPSRREAEGLLRVLEEHPAIPAVISFSARDALHVSAGDPFSSCAALVASAPSVIAVGVNCSAASDTAQLLAIGREATRELGLAAYPRSATATWGRRFRQLGATLIGGCCGTAPEAIRELRRELDAS